MEVSKKQVQNREKKDRVITFRLSKTDIEKYERYCIEEQIRISDLIRKQLQALPNIRFVE